MLLYHYCSSQTAFAILSNRVIRLSPLSSSNDDLEGRVVGMLFRDMLVLRNIPHSVADVVSFLLQSYSMTAEGFAFCLSEQGDLLSQWRAYASDAKGFSIGFKSEILSENFGTVNFGSQFFELKKVAYDGVELREKLQAFVDEFYREFFSLGDFVALGSGISVPDALKRFSFDDGRKGLIKATDSGHANMQKLLSFLSPLNNMAYEAKPSTFLEEREWRLLRYRHKVNLPELKYFSDGLTIRPYIEALIADPAKNVIDEIIIGPKNNSSIDWVRAFLDSLGLGHTKVKRSSITSYR